MEYTFRFVKGKTEYSFHFMRARGTLVDVG